MGYVQQSPNKAGSRSKRAQAVDLYRMYCNNGLSSPHFFMRGAQSALIMVIESIRFHSPLAVCNRISALTCPCPAGLCLHCGPVRASLSASPRRPSASHLHINASHFNIGRQVR